MVFYAMMDWMVTWKCILTIEAYNAIVCRSSVP
jgi:hypothetical protein